MAKIRPILDRLVVKQKEEVTKTESGLIIAPSAVEKPSEGVIIAVGPGKYLDNGQLVVPGVHAGMTVVFHKMAGTEVTVDGEKFLIMTEQDIMGIIE